MALIRLDIQTIVVGGGPVSSLMILKTHASDNIHTKNHNRGRLPIQIGPVEAMSIGTGVNSSSTQGGRPMTHDLLAMTIKALGATLDAVVINAVEGTTFFAQLRLIKSDGSMAFVDCRPSDAVALAVRTSTPIYTTTDVLNTASFPDFEDVEEEEKQHELSEFHKFVEGLSPEDFNESNKQSNKQ